MLGKLKQIFAHQPDRRERVVPFYSALIGAARESHWYEAGGVPDTMDGRFDMLSSIVALALLRLEKDGNTNDDDAIALTEVFIDDMDGSLRQAGVGDLMVGKRMGKLMGALGGRAGAYRDALAHKGDVLLADAVKRNVFRGEEVDAEHIAHVAKGLRAFEKALAGQDRAALLGGQPVL